MSLSERPERRHLNHGEQGATAEELEIDSLRHQLRVALALLERAKEWLEANPPGDEWDLLDHRANEERLGLLAAIRARGVR